MLPECGISTQKFKKRVTAGFRHSYIDTSCLPFIDEVDDDQDNDDCNNYQHNPDTKTKS